MCVRACVYVCVCLCARVNVCVCARARARVCVSVCVRVWYIGVCLSGVYTRACLQAFMRVRKRPQDRGNNEAALPPVKKVGALTPSLLTAPADTFSGLKRAHKARERKLCLAYNRPTFNIVQILLLLKADGFQISHSTARH